MTAMGYIVAGSIVASTGLLAAYLRWVWKLPQPWPYHAATLAVALIGLVAPWVAITIIAALVVIALVSL